MLKVGLTGGIACGKSTVSSIIAQLGVPVLDADQVARDVVAPDSDGLAEIQRHFGNDICLENGELNRPKLRDVIIADSKKRTLLESITHPRIFMKMLEWQQTQERLGHPVTLVEAALMVETGSYKSYDAVIVTTCAPDIQRSRLMARNQITLDTAQQWIDSQMPLSEKEAIADVLIYNDGTLDELDAQTRDVWSQLLDTLASNFN